MAVGPSIPADSVAAGPGAATQARQTLAKLRGSVLIVTLVALVVLGAILSPTFLTKANLQNVALNVAILGVVALGQTMVMLLRQIDLSIGSMMAFAPIAAIEISEAIYGLFGVSLIEGTNYVVNGMVLIVVLTLVVGAGFGLINGLITVRGLVPSLIVTLGMLYALRGGAYLLSGGHPLYLTDLPGYTWFGTALVFGSVPVSLLIFLALGLVVALALKYTKAGPAIYATGGNEKGAVYSGVNTGRWKVLAFAFSGLCAAVAAIFYTSRLASVEPAQAVGYELSAIAIAVVGGTTLQGGRGSMAGTILAAVILAVAINLITLKGLVIWYQTIIIGLIIVAAAFLYVTRGKRV